MTFIFRNRTIFWDISKWNRGQKKWDRGSMKIKLSCVYNSTLFFAIGFKPNSCIKIDGKRHMVCGQ